MNSKNYGNMGEADAIAKFCKAGIPIYLPFGDNEPADMIIDIGGRFLRIQCKSTYKDNEDSATFYLQSCTVNYVHTYSCNEVDYFYLYAVNADKSFLVKNIGNMKIIIIRFTSPKNNQMAGVHMYYDYEFNKVLHQLLSFNQ